MKLTNHNVKKILETRNPSQRNSMLKHSKIDAFDKDVIDGLTNSELLSSDFKVLDQKYFKKKRFSSTLLWMFIALILISGVSVLFYFDSIQETKEGLFANQKSESRKAIKSDTSAENEKKGISKTHTPINTKNSDKSKNPLDQNLNTIKTNEPQITNSVNNANETEKIKPLPINSSIFIESNSKGIVGKQGAEVYILDYKTLDYREYRKKSVKTSDPLSLTNGTPANSAEKNQNNTENQEIEYNYFNYLNESMKLFDKKMYSSALDNFNAILNTYSDDINALFYGGLCLFELNKYKESIQLFDRVSKSSFINFKEEGEWFLLQSYLETNEIEKAKLVRNEIINGNGFYAKKAKELKIP
jgi:TolA-binding protein